MATDYGRVSTISLSGSSDHIPHIRKIVACIADSAGLNSQEKTQTERSVMEACSTAVDSSSDPNAGCRFFLTLSASEGKIKADVEPHKN